MFSTEITLTCDGRFVIVDYVNDPIDLRLQSKTSDGVPEDIIRDMTERLVEFVGGPRLTLPSYQDHRSLSYREL